MAWNNLGLLCQRRGRWLEAEAAYREGLAADFTGAWINLGNLLWQPGREAEAEAAYEAALRASHRTAWFSLGLVRITARSRTLARSRIVLRLGCFVRVVKRER